MKFLEECATLLAEKMRTTDEKALRAIKKAEESKRIFCSIKQVIGKHRSQLTDIEVSTPSTGDNELTTMISNKHDMESHLIHRNKCHSKQSLSTPFFTLPILHQAINPFH
jgi:hypothetical protein